MTMTFKKALFSASSLALSMVCTSAALAEDSNAAAMEELRQLKAQLAAMNDLQRRVSQLEAQLQEQQAQSKPDPKAAKVSLKPGLTVETEDGSTTFSLDGRVAVDSGTVLDDSDSADLADATDLRTAWLGVKGKVDNVWKYRLLVGLEHDEVSMKDAYVSYAGFNNVDVTAGHFYENNGFEIMSGNLHTMFMESSGISTFRELRRLGVSVDPYGDNWGAQFGVFGTSPGDDGTDDEGRALSARVHFAPINEKDHVLHLGANGSYRKTDGGNEALRFRSRGESRVISERLIDTGDIAGVEDYLQYAIEAMYHYGPFSLHSEYIITDLSRNVGQDPTFTGGYIAASYFLTGENRSYDAQRGTYGRVKPTNPFSLNGGGTGAWEVAGRYSNVDLNDGGITGGEMDAYTLGMNWYPTSYTKFMLNYVYNELDENAVYPDDSPQYVMMRAQVDF